MLQHNKLDSFLHNKYFQNNLQFNNNSYNIRLDWKKLKGMNALAYFGSTFVTKHKKKFLTLILRRSRVRTFPCDDHSYHCYKTFFS